MRKTPVQIGERRRIETGLEAYRALVNEDSRDTPLNIKQNIEATVRSEVQPKPIAYLKMRSKNLRYLPVFQHSTRRIP